MAVASTITSTGNLIADLDLLTNLVTALVGTSTITASLASVTGLLTTLNGTGNLTGAMDIVAFLTTVLSGTGSITASLRGTLDLEAIIYVNESTVTINQIIEGVWNALSATYNNPGTMGEIMNNMGVAADPWTAVLENGYTAEELLRILVAVAVGKTTITDLGGGNANVKFRDLADSKDRVDADMTGSERTNITLDPS
jgi:hypothetical protein